MERETLGEYRLVTLCEHVPLLAHDLLRYRPGRSPVGWDLAFRQAGVRDAHAAHGAVLELLPSRARVLVAFPWFPAVVADSL